ncbi:MAG: Fe-S cluster assembly protein HesB [Mucilaginibacter sp.]|nr:Fe-S cluster assembly protein HesB [Mucilaginibacter sp.]
MEFFTIGVYNSTEQEFFDKLTENRIDTFCDIRQRRGVRGAKYAFVNSTRLQATLNELGIKYEYVAGLATPVEIREIQYNADHQKKELKRERKHLAPEFIAQYKEKVLDAFDFSGFIENLKQANAKRISLFCVEEAAEACHRSIVARKLSEEYSFTITNL